jgi:glycosyltransferase involved in cell wall biosynthesis
MTIARALKGSDEVHIMMPFMVGRSAAKLANRMGIPVSAGFHVQAENVTAHFFNFIKNQKINHMVYMNFWNHFYKYVDVIHYPTEFIRDTFEKNIHQKTPGVVISNGVSGDFHHIEIEREESLKGKFVILCTGRYSKEKRQALLLKAVALSKYKDKIQIVLAGEGPRLKELQKLSKKLGVEPQYRFFKRPEMVKMINMCDLYVHTSEIEIEAISCLEALSCGLVPVINDSPKSATKYFALEENNLFKLNDFHDLAKKIDYWVEHPEEKKECSKKYEAFCGQFNFDLCMEKMEKLIEDTAKIKKEPQRKE